MTDNEIIKSLEICSNYGDCRDCKINPHTGNYGYCTSLAIKAALDLIKRQKAEIEQWEEEANRYQKLWASAYTEAKADVVEVVRCKDCCKYSGKYCLLTDDTEDRRAPDDFCSCGERKEE